MKLKKFMAAGLATVMTVAMATTAFAADVTDPANATGTVEGAGKIEGYIEKEVFCVVLPTLTGAPFKLDPQELLKATQSANTLDTTQFKTITDSYGEKVMFYKDGNASSTDFLSKSGDISVVNKSSYAVDVNVTAKVTGNKKDGDGGYNIALVDKSADGWDGTRTDTYMELKLIPSTGKVKADGTASGALTPKENGAVALTDAADGVTVTETLAAADTNLFKVDKPSGGDYTYVIDTTKEASTEVSKVTFNLEGTVNKTADWKAYSADAASALKVNLAYEIKKHVDKATFTASTTEVGVINYVKGSGDAALKTIKSIKMTNKNGAFDGYNKFSTSWAAATDSNGKITFDSKYIAYYADKATYKATITYETVGGETKTAEVDVKTKADAAP